MALNTLDFLNLFIKCVFLLDFMPLIVFLNNLNLTSWWAELWRKKWWRGGGEC